jgi:tetratricopeptide (TPR) repeat protein
MGLARPALGGEAANEAATAHHRKALELYDAGDLSQALVEFERAYAANGNYRPLFNIGELHFQLGHYAKAQQSLEKYLKEGGDAIPQERRGEVEQDLAKLRLRTATLAVAVDPPDASVHINDEPAPPKPTLVNAGRVHVRVEKDGYASLSRDVVVAGGEQQMVTVKLVPLASAPPPPQPVTTEEGAGVPPLAIAGWITTGVLAAGAVGTGIAALSESSSYDDARARPITTSLSEAKRDLEHQRSTVSALGITTDVLGAAAIVAGGVSLYLTLRPREPSAPTLRVQGLGANFAMGF